MIHGSMLSYSPRPQGRSTLRALCLGSWLVLCLVPVVVVHAQQVDASRAASARALFQEGLQFADQNRWHEATDRFQRALALRESPVIAYNLASALEHLGSLVKASELLRSVIADPITESDLRRSAETSLAGITPRIARVTVHANGRREGDRVVLDDRDMLDAQLDVPVPIDPGVHVIGALRGDQTLDSQTVELGEKQSAEVALELGRVPAPEEVAQQAAPAPAADRARTGDDRRDEPALTSRWWFWAGVGAVAAGVVITALAVSSSGSNEPAMAKPGDTSPGSIGVTVAGNP
jgi:tetratricopeptide (TPR) repeat protein